MDIDHEGESPLDEKAPSMASHASPVVPAGRATAPTSGGGRRLIPFALLGIMTIGTGLAAFFAVCTGTTPSQAVASALTNSLRFKSAAITLSLAVSEPGGTATITSEGTTNFDTADTDQHTQIVSGTQHIREHTISEGPTIYIHIDGGAIARVVAGKSWVSLPATQSAASGSTVGGGASNSAAVLRVLSATGNDVSDLGSSRVNGESVHLYAVHLTRSQITRDIAKEDLPEYARQALALALVHIPAITYTLAIDGANQLMQTKANLHLRVGGQQITERLTEGYSHYGAKLTVMAPPSHEVIPYLKFLRIAEEKNDHVTI
jgi:hypothetical protein